MLVLKRNLYQKIMIGDDIVITVVEVCSDSVKLGFDAPNEVPIHRQEIYDRIKEEGG